MDFLKILVIIAFIIVSILTIKFHPEIHKPMIIEDANFKLTRISDSLITNKNIPVSSAAQTSTKNIQNTTNNKNINIESNKNFANIQKTQNTNTQSNKIQDDTTQLELLQRIIDQTENNQPTQTESKQVKKQKTEVAKNPKYNNPYMTEQEEIIAWNRWRSNIQNQIMRDSKIDYAPLGTMFLFTFVVDKFGNVSNIKVECSNPDFMNIARERVKPAIAGLQKKPILNFPRGTQRTSTVVTGIFLIGTQERYSTPDDFSDYERVTY